MEGLYRLARPLLCGAQMRTQLHPPHLESLAARYRQEDFVQQTETVGQLCGALGLDATHEAHRSVAKLLLGLEDRTMATKLASYDPFLLLEGLTGIKATPVPPGQRLSPVLSRVVPSAKPRVPPDRLDRNDVWVREPLPPETMAGLQAEVRARLRRIELEGRAVPHHHQLVEREFPPLPTIEWAKQDGAWKNDGPYSPLPPWSFLREPEALLPNHRPDAAPLAAPGVGPWVRNAEAPLKNGTAEAHAYAKAYLTDLGAMMREVFLPQLEDGRLFADFRGSLRAQHQAFVAGGYRGHSVGQASEPNAGQYIFESGRRYVWDVGRHFDSLGLAKGHSMDGLHVALKAHLAQTPITLSGLPKEAWPGLLPNPNKLLFQVPPPEWMPKILDRMGALLEQTFQNLDRPESLTSLADYLHLGCVGHFFSRANYSIFMSHVNYALERMGLLPIAHGYLDYAALCMGHEEFRGLFWDAVAVQNPGLKRPGAPGPA